jgi:hypothetical protein
MLSMRRVFRIVSRLNLQPRAMWTNDPKQISATITRPPKHRKTWSDDRLHSVLRPRLLRFMLGAVTLDTIAGLHPYLFEFCDNVAGRRDPDAPLGP